MLSATAMVSTVSSVNRHNGWNSGLNCDVRADIQPVLPSYTDPMMSPAIAPSMDRSASTT